MFVLYALFLNGSAVSERIVSQQTHSDLRELLLDLLLELVPILGLALSLLVLQLLSFVLVPLRQLLRIKTAILRALTHRGFPRRLLPAN